MSSVVDDTNLPALVPEILKKRPEDRNQMEKAVLDIYNRKHGPNGAEKVGEVAGYEADLSNKGENKLCRKYLSIDDCLKGSPGHKCPVCNPSGKL